MNLRTLLYSCLLTGSLLFSCKEEALIDYQGQNSIYFEGTFDESLNKYIPKSAGQMSFGYVDGLIKDSIYTVIVNCMGKPVVFDRPYELSVVDSSTLQSGVDYEFLNETFFIPAGKTQDSVKVRLIRNARMAEAMRLLSLKLKANENFNIDMQTESLGSGSLSRLESYNAFVLRVDDIVGCPWFWDPLLNKNGATVERYLGPFTPRKLQIMIARYNLNIATITRAGYMPLPGQLLAWAFDMQSYLDEQEKKGEPIYEADNKTLMKMGPAAK